MIFFYRFLRYFLKIRTSSTLKKSHGYYKYLSQELSDRISLLPYDLQAEIESRVTWFLPKHVGCIYTWQHEKSFYLLATVLVKTSKLKNAENDKIDGICSALLSGYTIARFSFRLYHNTQETCRKSNTCLYLRAFILALWRHAETCRN